MKSTELLESLGYKCVHKTDTIERYMNEERMCLSFYLQTSLLSYKLLNEDSMILGTKVTIVPSNLLEPIKLKGKEERTIYRMCS